MRTVTVDGSATVDEAMLNERVHVFSPPQIKLLRSPRDSFYFSTGDVFLSLSRSLLALLTLENGEPHCASFQPEDRISQWYVEKGAREISTSGVEQLE